MIHLWLSFWIITDNNFWMLKSYFWECLRPSGLILFSILLLRDSLNLQSWHNVALIDT